MIKEVLARQSGELVLVNSGCSVTPSLSRLSATWATIRPRTPSPSCLWRCSIRPVVGGCDRWGVHWRATGPV